MLSDLSEVIRNVDKPLTEVSSNISQSTELADLLSDSGSNKELSIDANEGCCTLPSEFNNASRPKTCQPATKFFWSPETS
jgi:hypothetical protein